MCKTEKGTLNELSPWSGQLFTSSIVLFLVRGHSDHLQFWDLNNLLQHKISHMKNILWSTGMQLNPLIFCRPDIIQTFLASTTLQLITEDWIWWSEMHPFHCRHFEEEAIWCIAFEVWKCANHLAVAALVGRMFQNFMCHWGDNIIYSSNNVCWALN